MNRVLKNLTGPFQKVSPLLVAPKGKKTPLAGGEPIPDFAALVKSSMDLGQVKPGRLSRSILKPPEIRLNSDSKILAFTPSASSPLHSEPSRIHPSLEPDVHHPLNTNSKILAFTQSASSPLHSEPSRIHPSLEPEVHHVPIAENRSTEERSSPPEFMRPLAEKPGIAHSVLIQVHAPIHSEPNQIIPSLEQDIPHTPAGEHPLAWEKSTPLEFIHQFVEKPGIASPESVRVHAPINELSVINERAVLPSPVDSISGNQSVGANHEARGGHLELNELRLPDARTISLHSDHSPGPLPATFSDRFLGQIEIQTVVPAEPRLITQDFKPVASPISENETDSPQTDSPVLTESSGDTSEDTGEGVDEALPDIEFTTKETAVSSFAAASSTEEGSSSDTVDYNGLEAAESSPGMESAESETGSHSLVEAGLSEGGKGSGHASAKLETPSGGATGSRSPAFFMLRKPSSGRGLARAQQRARGSVSVTTHQTKNPQRISHSSSLQQSTPTAPAPKSPVLAPEIKSAQTQVPSSSSEEKLTKLLDVKDLAEKIMARARLTNNDVRTLEIRLNPPHLGLLRLQVVTQGEEMRMWVTADRPEMAPVLKEAQPDLVKVVAEQGYNLVQCDVENHDLHSRWPEGYPSSGTNSPRELRDSYTGDSARQALEESEHLQPLNFGYNTLDLVA